jgi:hypothetical protein
MSGTARKSGGGRTARLDYAARIAQSQNAHAIPLNLGPMLAVYKERRRVSLRIEGMPHLSRLSAGRNNGDNSWSLSFSDIDTLAYLPPEGAADETLTLSVRVIDLDSGGSTLAVLDMSVSPTAAEQGPDADDTARDTQMRALREELEQAKSALKERDTDLAQLRQKSQRAESELTRARIESELGGGRSRKGEVDESKFASLNSKLVPRGADPNAAAEDEPTDSAENNAAFLVRKGKAQPSTVVPAEGALSEEKAQALFGAARQKREQEVAAALAKAEAAWKADEAKRLAAAEAQWRAKAAAPQSEAMAQAEERARRAEKALAEASARNDTLVARHRESATELERLGQECAELRKGVAERESAIVQTSDAGKRAREEAQHKSEQALARASEVWRAEEAARFAAAEAQWRSQSSSAIAALNTRCERAEQALAEVTARAQFASQRNAEATSEIQSLREESAGLRKRHAEREANLARAQEDFERAREKSERETKDTVAKAEAAWKTDAAARLAALESAWQQKLAAALAEANTRAERAEHALAEVTRKIEASSSRESELENLRRQCAAMKAQLDEHAVAFADAHTGFDESRKSWRREAEAALANAEAAWKAGEAARLAAAQQSWETKAAGALKEAQARREAAEKALADGASRSNALHAELAKISENSRGEIDALRGRASENDRLRAEISELRAVVARQESALAGAPLPSAAANGTSHRDVEESVAAAQAAWKADETARLAAAEAQWRRQSESAKGELGVRCERAERSLQEAREQTELLSARDQNNRFELRRLREELAVAQGALASREAELESIRAEQDLVAEPAIVLQPDRISGFDSYEREQPKPKGHLMRDAMVVAFLGVAAVLGWPWIEAYVPQVNELLGNVSVQAPRAPAPTPEVQPERPSAVVIHAGNVRSGPSANSPTSGTLQAGAKVEPIEKQGNWTKVRIEAPNAPVKEGWIYSSFLQDENAAAPKAQTGKGK